MTNDKTAIILLGHGSRAAGAAEDMEKVVARLMDDPQYDMVDICQMQGLGEHFPEVFDRCVARGATRVVVVPYFLHFGIHLRQDVPEMMMEKARQYPEVKMTLGKHLGYDDALVDIVKKRIGESEELCDIRDMEIEHIDNEHHGNGH
jgi:sirohydrochlorin ferrochelatase